MLLHAACRILLHRRKMRDWRHDLPSFVISNRDKDEDPRVLCARALLHFWGIAHHTDSYLSLMNSNLEWVVVSFRRSNSQL